MSSFFTTTLCKQIIQTECFMEEIDDYDNSVSIAKYTH